MIANQPVIKKILEITATYYLTFLIQIFRAYSIIIEKNIVNHSMARDNLNKSKKFLTSTTTASKYITKRPRICINWNPPFQTQIYLVKIPLNVNIVKQDLLNKKQFLKILWSDVWKGGFQLIQILGLLGMYFDALW